MFQQDIAAAADAAVRKYKEDTEEKLQTSKGVAVAMRCSIKDATERLYKKLSKLVAVANPALTPEWLVEVSYVIHIFGSLAVYPLWLSHRIDLAFLRVRRLSVTGHCMLSRS